MLVADEGVTGLDIATFVIACSAGLIALMSLGWNIVAHYQTGVRVRVRLTCGLLTDSNYGCWEPATTDRPFTTNAEGLPMFAVTVRNIGRLPAVVASVSFGNKLITTPDVNDGPSPGLPHTVEVSADATWFIQASAVTELARMLKLADPDQRTDQVHFTVGLGNGKWKRTESVSVDKTLEQLLNIKGPDRGD